MANRLPPYACFVTGTDTGAGKTWASCGLLAAFAATGRTTVGMKPVATGCVKRGDAWQNEDALALQRAGNIDRPYELINPVALPDPVAPHIAPASAGRRIDLVGLCDAYRQLASGVDAVVVEGIGGWRVPLATDLSTVDLVRALDLPVVMVVGLRLGCISHALLTAECIVADQVVLAGWLATQCDPDYDVTPETMNYLSEQIAAPMIGVIPHLDALVPARIASCLQPELLTGN